MSIVAAAIFFFLMVICIIGLLATAGKGNSHE